MPDSPEASTKSDAEAPEAAHPLAWNRSQRRALLALLTVLLVVLLIRYALNPAFISDPQPEHPAGADRLANRIDPNTADLQTLAFMPTLGEKRAQAIIDFRTQRQRLHPGHQVFHVPEDLLAIKGFGPATVDNLRPFLIFPKTQPTSMP